MQRCPHCSEALDGLVPICWHCGRAVDVSAVTPQRPAPADTSTVPPNEQTLFDQSWFEDNLAAPPEATAGQDSDIETWSTMDDGFELPRAASASSTAPMPAPPVGDFAAPAAAFSVEQPSIAVAAVLNTPAEPKVRPRWQLPALAVAGLGTVLVAVSVMGRPASNADSIASPPAAAPSAPPQQTASAPAATAPAPAASVPATPPPAATAPAPAPQPAPPPATPAKIVEVEEAPAWIVPRRTNFGPDGSRTLTLQLAALGEVRAGREQIRPMLAVRCLSRRTDVFVSLGISASIEGGDNHTVTVQFDDEAPIKQQWPGSASYQEVFAPDGVATARRLAQTRMMRFTFTPFGSRPVTAEFHVQGFDRHVKDFARMCGWPVQDAANPRRK